MQCLDAGGAPDEGVERDETAGYYVYWPGISDGAGDYVATTSWYKYSHYQFYPSGGGDSVGAVELGFNIPSGGFSIAPQPRGYHGLLTGGDTGGPLLVLDSTGNVVSSGGTQAPGVAIAGDPAGGSALFTAELHPDYTRTYRLERADDAGRLLGATILDGYPTTLAINDHHDALVIASSTGGYSARWFDAEASPITDWFYLPTLPPGGLPWPYLARLPNGRIALAAGRDWSLVFPDATGAAEASPQWLRDRSGTNITVVRGGRAYAVVPLQGPRLEGTCVPARFEVVTAPGESCGLVELPGESCNG